MALEPTTMAEFLVMCFGLFLICVGVGITLHGLNLVTVNVDSHNWYSLSKKDGEGLLSKLFKKKRKKAIE